MDPRKSQAEQPTRTPKLTPMPQRAALPSRSTLQTLTAPKRPHPAQLPSHPNNSQSHSPSAPTQRLAAQSHSQRLPQVAQHHTRLAGTLETARSSQTVLK